MEAMHSSIELVKESLPGGNLGGFLEGRSFVQKLLRPIQRRALRVIVEGKLWRMFLTHRGTMTIACQRLEILPLSSASIEESYPVSIEEDCARRDRRMNGGTAACFLTTLLSHGRRFSVIEYIHPGSV